jgi:GT2 family glycosyltransferase
MGAQSTRSSSLLSTGSGAVYNRQQSRVKTVTIAIPSLHRPDLTARCIQFIEKQTLPTNEWEILVIENEARPDKILPDPLPPNTRRIELPDNEGTTGSINRAVAASESRYVMLLNNDIELEPDYLERLVSALDADPALGFVTGKLRRATQRTHLDGAGDAMLMAGGGYRLGHLDADTGQFDRAMPVLAGCGAAVLYRREAFINSGGLDLEFFAYLDDLDLALRAQLLGFGGLYMPDATAYHIGSATLGDTLHPRVIEYLTRNQIFLLLKDYPQPVLFRLLPRIVVYQGMWLLFALRKRALGAYFRGLVGGLSGSGSMRAKHRDLLATRRVSDAEFLKRLRDSERQIYDWHQSRPQQDRSALLNFYFRIFGRP